MYYIVDKLLDIHEHVTVDNRSGNHDGVSSKALNAVLLAKYGRESRVTIVPNHRKFSFYRHGKCLIASTHGDTVKYKDLPGVLMTDATEHISHTVHRRWYTGHVHHESVKEFHGCVVETFRTLAAKDAWHAAQGYRAARDMRMDQWHVEDGLYNRHIVGIGRIRRIQQQQKEVLHGTQSTV